MIKTGTYVDSTNRAWAIHNDINCEHSWPQSLLDSSRFECDMHHLYATEVQVNGDRGNYPFGEIQDNQTTYWYRNNVRTTTMPGANIDEWAEYLQNTRFEPREVQKGNTARSMYYVLTMYQLHDTTTGFWTGQKSDLYTWHVADPADVREIDRTHAIAHYQQNKPNPFVLDSTLIRRAYFPGMGVSGRPAALGAGAKLLGNRPNPFQGSTTIQYSLEMPARVDITIYNVLGLEVATIGGLAAGPGAHSTVWNGHSSKGALQPPGIYFYQLRVGGTLAATRRMLLVR